MIADKGAFSQAYRYGVTSRTNGFIAVKPVVHLLESTLNPTPEATLKHVLVINYSQTGQLADIAAQLIKPLREAGHQVHQEPLVPVSPFPFPWPIVDFVDAMPECVQLDAPPLKPLSIAADADFEAAVVYGKRIVRSVLEKKVELPLCLNVNVPVGKPGELHGIRLCRQNRGFWREEFYRHEDPRGRAYFWLTGDFVNGEPGAEDTDEWALAHGYVSIVPVQVDLTDYRQLAALANVLE